MARKIGPTVEILMRRVRQEGGLAVDPDFATEIYTRCEQVVNKAFGLVISTATLTIPKQKLLHTFRTSFSTMTDAASIVRLYQSNRDLLHCGSLKEFATYEKNWFRNITGSQLEAWTQFGNDLLITYPGLSTSGSVSCDYVKLLTVYTDFSSVYNTSSDLPDESVDLALGLAEAILLLRLRRLPAISLSLKRLLNAAKFKELNIK